MDPALLQDPSPQASKLSARQEELLFAALNSNKSTAIKTSNLQSSNKYAMAPSALTESPLQQVPGSGTLSGFEESPFIDYDYDFEGDNSFDYDFANDIQGEMIGKLPGTSSDGDGDLHDKRSHPDDDEEDEEGGGKRREGEEKSSKKPGRKPLTSEPTTVSALMLPKPMALSLTHNRNAKLKTVLLKEHSGRGKKNISKTSRLKSKIFRKPQSRPIMRTVCFVRKSRRCQ